MASSMQGGLSILCIIAIVLCSRLIYISWNIWVARRAPFKAVKARNAVKTLVVLGSGKHTNDDCHSHSDSVELRPNLMTIMFSYI